MEGDHPPEKKRESETIFKRFQPLTKSESRLSQEELSFLVGADK